jgi:hypothetical protein
MVSVSRAFHIWCGLVPFQGALHSLSSGWHISTADARIFASNHACLTIIKKYQLDLEDKSRLRGQIDDAILRWKAHWFKTHTREEGGALLEEEEILTEVIGALISGPNCLPQFSKDELNEDHVVTALVLVSLT